MMVMAPEAAARPTAELLLSLAVTKQKQYPQRQIRFLQREEEHDLFIMMPLMLRHRRLQYLLQRLQKDWNSAVYCHGGRPSRRVHRSYWRNLIYGKGGENEQINLIDANSHFMSMKEKGNNFALSSRKSINADKRKRIKKASNCQTHGLVWNAPT